MSTALRSLSSRPAQSPDDPARAQPRAARSGPRRRQAVLFAVAVVLAAIVGACSASASTAPSTAASPPVGASGQVAGTASSAAPEASAAPTFPLAITDDEGTSVTIASAPARIVSLAPSVTETLFALGEGTRVVGVTASDDYPPAAVSLPRVATYTGVEAEKVVAARPDLVFAWKGITSAADIAKLRSLGMPVLVLYAKTVDQVLADIGLVGRATAAGPAAAALVASLRARIDAITAAAAAAGNAPRVFYELDATKAIFGLAPDDFTADLIRRARGVPVTSGTPGVYSISLERLIAADPQVIVLGDASYGTTPAQVRARPGWGGIAAVRNGAIRPVDDVIVTRPGPRIADGLAALAEAIHPGIVLPPGSTSPPVPAVPGASGSPASPAASASH